MNSRSFSAKQSFWERKTLNRAKLEEVYEARVDSPTGYLSLVQQRHDDT